MSRNHSILFSVGILLLGFWSCGDGDSDPETGQMYRAVLSGAHEVPPVNTAGGGQATFESTGTGITFRIELSNLTQVAAAHIHEGAPGENGDVVVTLYMGEVTGDVDGVLVEGTFTQGDNGETMNQVLNLLNSGNSYVNIHTVTIATGEVRGPITLISTP